MFFWFLFIVGPLVGGVVLDLLFGTWGRWWRWWFPPLLVGLAGVGFMVWVIETTGSHNEVGLLLYVLAPPFFVLLPAVAAASGVGLRRWMARSVAKRPIDEIRAARK